MTMAEHVSPSEHSQQDSDGDPFRTMSETSTYPLIGGIELEERQTFYGLGACAGAFATGVVVALGASPAGLFTITIAGLASTVIMLSAIYNGGED